MKNLGLIQIVNHHSREREAKAMAMLLERESDEPVEQVVDYDTWGVWKTYRKAFDTPNNKEWRLILQDDVSFSCGLLENIDEILNFVPQKTWMSFYCPTNGSFKECYQMGCHVLKSPSNFSCLCMAMRESDISAFRKWELSSGYPEDQISEDARMKTFNLDEGHLVYTIVPSLTQHLGAYRSTLGTNGKVGKFHRNSFCYEPDFDVQSVDWKDAMSKPYKCKAGNGKVHRYV
jgi:hypothetical protein